MSHLAFPLLPQNESTQQYLIISETAWLLGTDEQSIIYSMWKLI